MHCWRSAVDDEGAVTSEGIAAVKGWECECGVVACGVLDGAVEGEEGLVVEIGRGIACLNGVGESECGGAGSRGVGGV